MNPASFEPLLSRLLTENEREIARCTQHGSYLYDGQDLDFGSADEHEHFIIFNEAYLQCIEDQYSFVNAVEESDPLEDWVSQEMTKPHVRVIKDRLNFTDTQIRNALESLHDRGEVVTFDSLRDLLTQTRDGVLNMYVGSGQYAFSADVQLVLNRCYAIYHGREPTQPEFDYQWNRIKGTGIENLMDQVAEKEVEMTHINRDRDRLLERSRLLNNQVIYEREWAYTLEEEIRGVQVVNETRRLQVNRLELEKEAEKVKAVRLEQEKEAEKVKAVRLEQEKEEAEAKIEQLKQMMAEKDKLLLQMQSRQ